MGRMNRIFPTVTRRATKPTRPWNYPLVMTNIAIENLLQTVIFHGYVSHNQRVHIITMWYKWHLSYTSSKVTFEQF